MNADQLTHTACCSGTSVGRGLYGPDIATNEYRHVARADVFLSDQLNIRGFDHCVRRLNRADESFGLDHSECF
jgi:hypothetical protein